jgi:hypothetical protein
MMMVCELAAGGCVSCGKNDQLVIFGEIVSVF